MASQHQQVSAGCGVAVLDGLTPRHRENLLHRAQYRRFVKNQTICPQGERANFFYLIQDGWVSVCRHTVDGQEVVFDIAGPGQCLQVLPAVLDTCYSTELKAVSPEVGILCFPGSSLRAIVQHDAALHQLLLSALYDQLQTMENAFEQVKTKTASQRVIDFLLNEIRAENGTARVTLPYDKTVISSKLGIKPESLSRVLNQLRAWGIFTDGNVITVSSVRKLRQARAEAGS